MTSALELLDFIAAAFCELLFYYCCIDCLFCDLETYRLSCIGTDKRENSQRGKGMNNKIVLRKRKKICSFEYRLSLG